MMRIQFNSIAILAAELVDSSFKEAEEGVSQLTREAVLEGVEEVMGVNRHQRTAGLNGCAMASLSTCFIWQLTTMLAVSNYWTGPSGTDSTVPFMMPFSHSSLVRSSPLFVT